MKRQLTTAKRWLTPGLGLKRWALFIFLGMTILALGLGLFLRDLYGSSGYPDIIRLLALQDLPRWLRATIFGSIGFVLILFGFYKMSQTMVYAFLPQAPGHREVANILHNAHRRRRGPKVVTIGGGTGMSVLLRGLKAYTDNITAIVTVADDGGSSGRLRRSLGVLPPGDFRNCIAALGNDEALTTQLFQYRFAKGEQNSGLEGHSFGNLFIIAMAAVTGSFERALAESGKVLTIRGEILPSTLADVTLFADVTTAAGAEQVRGESAIPETNAPIERVYLEPDKPAAYPGAIRAILEADLIILGPGSLFTSLLPNLLVPDIREAIEASQALKVYVCNVATQAGETENFTLHDHIQALEKHVGPSLFSHVLVNNNLPSGQSETKPVTKVPNLVIPHIPSKMGYRLVKADLINEDTPWRHDSAKLAKNLIYWYQTEVSKKVS